MITTKIVPAIMVENDAELQSQLNVAKDFAKRVQIDIADGQFVPATTISEAQVVAPADVEVDLHMMVVKPSEHLQTILNLKPHLCILHPESGEDLLPLFAQLKNAGILAGLALMKNTFPGRIKPLIEQADHVMIFAGELGRQGSDADLLQMEKIPLIREIKADVELGWDGGANIKNVRALAHAGIDIINVGSALSRAENPLEMFNLLQADVEKKGVVL